MKRRRLLVVVAAVLVVVVAAMALDLARPYQERLSTGVLALVSEACGMSLLDEPRRFVSESEVRVYLVQDEASVGDPCDGSVPAWRDVQDGNIALVENLGVAVVSAGCAWEMGASEYFQRFEALNPRAVRLPDGQHHVPRFLLVQEGGGVEGLERQVFLGADATALVWDVVDPSGEELQQLPEPRRVEVPEAMAGHLFELASEADLRPLHRTEGIHGHLDGSVTTIVVFDGKDLGRLHLVNHVQPSGSLLELVQELERLAGTVEP